jgi:thymidylate synthase
MLADGILPTGYLDMAAGKLILSETGYQAPTAEPVQEEAPQPEQQVDDSILKEIRQVNDDIPDEVMSAKIDRIEEITGKILNYQKAHPDKAGQLRSFLNYYLPTTLKILRAYAQLDAQGIEGENISAAKARIEGMMDQVDRVIYDLKNNPFSRRITTNIYVHQDLHEMNLYPCAYSMTFNVTGNKLNGILNQRSQDMLTANNWNICQYAILLHMFAQVSNLEVGELVHVIADAHIYDKHIPLVEEMIKRPQFKAPKLKIDSSITNFYDFTVDSFELVDYEYNPPIGKIEVAV